MDLKSTTWTQLENIEFKFKFSLKLFFLNSHMVWNLFYPFSSQIIVLRNGDDVQKLLIRENEHVRKIEEWSASTEGEEFVRSNSSIGGYYKYPPLSTNLEDYKDGFNSDKPFTVCSNKITKSSEILLLYQNVILLFTNDHVIARHQVIK